jgi:hypothetical protein
VERLTTEVEDEERATNMYVDIIRRTAKALGKPFEGPGSSWHDLPKWVERLKAELGGRQ